ncbi:MAG: sodium/proline symporter [Oscillospiraceae bacterium]|nr:sodium/proline symporter [Oscillospiraceae bacterium]
MSSSGIFIILAIVIYLVGMLYIGYRHSRGNNTSEDFYLGGRRLGPIVAAMSTEASDMSAYLLMGVPGLALFCGVAEASWTAIGLAAGTYLNWLFVAKRLRSYSAKLDAITVPDFLSRRFRDNTKLIETVGALVIIIFFVPYTASGFVACGKLFNSMFGWAYLPTMIVSAIVIVAYCTMGGFMAASITSLIQSLVMTFALIVVLLFGIHSVGGWDAVVANAKTVPGYLSLFASTNIVAASAGSYGGIAILSTLAWGLGYFGMPHVLIHFMAAKDEKMIKTSRRIATVWVVVSLGVAVIIGIVGFGMVNAGVISGFASSSEAESVIVRAAGFMSQKNVFFAIIAGIILAGILSATMSTADVQLLAAASGITQNLLKDVFGLKLDDRKNLLVARLGVIAIAIIALFFAMNPNSSIFRVVSFAWAGFGATFGPVMLFALFWKRCNKQGAIAGMISGAVMIFIWKFLVRPLGGAWDIYELLPAFIVASILIIVVSLATKEPEAEIVKEFESVNAG